MSWFLVDRDWVYHVTEFSALAFSTACVILMTTELRSTYQREVDSFGAQYIPTEIGIVYIVAPCLLLAVVRAVAVVTAAAAAVLLH